MSLQDIVTNTKRLSDSVIVLELENEFALECERSGRDDKFALLYTQALDAVLSWYKTSVDKK